MKKAIALIISLPLVLLGAQWQSLDGPPAGRADDMTIGRHGSQYIIYAADRTHKLYKSVNEGEFWDSILPLDVVNPVCVICDPNEAWTVYIGKEDATPVWKSDDGGVNWYPRSSGITNTQPLCFAMDPNNSSVVYLGCQKDDSQYEMFKTTNGGTDWSALSNSPNVTVNDIAITHDPLRGTWIIAGCSGSSDRGIWLSINGGIDWDQKLSDVDIYSVEFANQSTGYAGASSGVYRTE
ncbi:MAG TPA: hypothetical protein ENI34_02235, partial [candidate division WOR-3 bacterium]|nr:hypothetical protein [candidate division WOR-3 bacterium]